MKERQDTDVLAETKPLETIPNSDTDGEETQQLRRLTVQEIEHILKDEAPQ